ncbi:uncharacterized protein LOC125225160 [Leguminivora glycinivorella]|uniref:uncharacterized protein LOC125225160 n=1 Tax=Leguminivora glycinivorella TaxID=1035111 RepID=UPI0020107A25|nr:uncharacterized protein LOC125225160 [Leguminivora glycinivorella]
MIKRCVVSVLIFFILYYFTLLNVNTSDYFTYLSKNKVSLFNESLAQLLNANSITNIPAVNLITKNQEIITAQHCRDGPIYMGTEYYVNDKLISSGVWCTLKTVDCNMKTGYVVSGVNGVVCKSKYPDMFGGNDASTVVACNNEDYPSTGSVLWDYLYNERVNPETITMTKDELLADGSFRFRCKFSQDANKNQYIEHPANRFHPIVNPCTKSIFAASLDVKLVKTPSTWHCDCGDFDKTS